MHTPSLASLLHLAAPMLAGALILAPSIQAGVYVVDLAGGGDFELPSDAIEAAVDGDIIVIRPGDYTTRLNRLDTRGKALVIVGDVGGETILPVTEVKALPAGKTCVLRNLRFEPSSAAEAMGTGATLEVRLCAGRVHIEECTIRGLDGPLSEGFVFAADGQRGLVVNNSVVAVHRSTILGGNGTDTLPGFGFPPSAAGSAIVAFESQLSLHQVNATGGEGGSFGTGGADGGHGLVVHENAHAIVSGCTLTGGDKGGTTPFVISGSGAWLAGFEPMSLSEIDTQCIGGAGAPGQMIPAWGTHQVWDGEAWTLALSAPVLSGSVGTLTANGPPNEMFGLFFSLGMGYLPKASLRGAFLPAAPFFGPLFLATTDATGTWTTPFIAPSLAGFGLEGLLNIDQAIMKQDVGLVLSSATAYIQVEPPN